MLAYNMLHFFSLCCVVQLTGTCWIFIFITVSRLMSTFIQRKAAHRFSHMWLQSGSFTQSSILLTGTLGSFWTILVHAAISLSRFRKVSQDLFYLSRENCSWILSYFSVCFHNPSELLWHTPIFWWFSYVYCNIKIIFSCMSNTGHTISWL